VANRWYPVALANKIHGSDLDPTRPDMILRFNSLFATTYYYGLDGDTPFNKTDFISTVLLEIIHGLGFGSQFYRNADGLGTWWDGVYPLISDPYLALEFHHRRRQLVPRHRPGRYRLCRCR
jgi:hypothetical protein